MYANAFSIKFSLEESIENAVDVREAYVRASRRWSGDPLRLLEELATPLSALWCNSIDTLVLECWVYSDDSYTTFPVKISRTESVGSLEKVMKDENSDSLNSVGVRHLIFYIPMPQAGGEHFEATLGRWTFKGQTRLSE